MNCTCWVSKESAEMRFGIRYGAHGLQCPQYRISLDPVDAAEDAELRLRYEPTCRGCSRTPTLKVLYGDGTFAHFMCEICAEEGYGVCGTVVRI